MMTNKIPTVDFNNHNTQNFSRERIISLPSSAISIIIPTYNEAGTVADLIKHLQHHAPGEEIIVVDGGSRDDTVRQVRDTGARCLTDAQKGRAAQMNEGAAQATGDILYFVHADTLPPPNFPADIRKSVKNGYRAGCFRSRFDSDHPMLKFNSFMTRFGGLMCRGGDQTLYITRALFEQLGGFRNDYLIMEDFEMVHRIEKTTDFNVIAEQVQISARKYEDNNYLRVQFANFVVFMMYSWGASQQKLIQTYKRLIDYARV